MTALARLPNTVTLPEMIATMDRDGGAIVKDFLSPETIAALKADLLPHIEARGAGRDDFTGFQTRRMSALFAKSRHVADIMTHPLFLGLAEHYVNVPVTYGSGDYARAVRPGLRAGGTQLIQIGPGEIAQPLHRDHWAMLWRYPDYGAQARVQIMVAISDFTEENGATMVVPGSHTWGEDRVPDPADAVPAVMTSGSVLFFLGSTHHGGGANRTADAYRTGLTMGLDSAALRQEENLYLALSPDVVKSYPEHVQRLLGWTYTPETFMGWVEIDGEIADPIRLLA